MNRPQNMAGFIFALVHAGQREGRAGAASAKYHRHIKQVHPHIIRLTLAEIAVARTRPAQGMPSAVEDGIIIGQV
jgi:hypothetical protein